MKTARLVEIHSEKSPHLDEAALRVRSRDQRRTSGSHRSDRLRRPDLPNSRRELHLPAVLRHAAGLTTLLKIMRPLPLALRGPAGYKVQVADGVPIVEKRRRERRDCR